MSNARSQQKRKERKRAKRKQLAHPRPAAMGARTQLNKALEAVSQLQQLEGLNQLGDLGVLVQKLLQEVTELRPLLDAVIEDNQALAEIQETLLRATLSLYDTVPGSSDEIRAQLAVLVQPSDEDAG